MTTALPGTGDTGIDGGATAAAVCKYGAPAFNLCLS
jgi:hypothetical protein